MTASSLIEMEELARRVCQNDWHATTLGIDALAIAQKLARAYLEATARAREGWQPIEQWAEADGPVIVCEDAAVGEAVCHGEEGWYWAGIDPTDNHGRRIYPTMFQHLPKPFKAM